MQQQLSDMRNIILFSFLFVLSGINAQTVSISGLAPAYIGKKIRFYKIEDYLSNKQTLIGSATIGIDSSFNMTINCDEIQKIVVKSNNNRGFIYVSSSGAVFI